MFLLNNKKCTLTKSTVWYATEISLSTYSYHLDRDLYIYNFTPIVLCKDELYCLTRLKKHTFNI
jgi:hypothetical protein